MPKHTFLRCLALALLGVTLAASAQDYPTRPITMVMPYAPGGPGDAITRVFAASMQKTLGQTILVDNTALVIARLTLSPNGGQSTRRQDSDRARPRYPPGHPRIHPPSR